MKFWLVCFVVLFAGAELFDWVMQASGGELSGAWWVLGGMGLAAASNAKHLTAIGADSAPSIEQSTEQSDEHSSDEHSSERSAVKQPVASPPLQPLDRNEISVKETTNSEATATTNSTEDTISFKVRLPWF
ncbi:MAG: hypothetical protein AAF171_00495 [Cyanobacteria bacterium P01_A01_bin.116]